MTGATDRGYDADLLDVMSTRVLVGDGAMGIAFTSKVAKRVGVDRGDELGVPDVNPGDDVDFSGREALQRFRVPAGIRHARQSQGRLPLRKECT